MISAYFNKNFDIGIPFPKTQEEEKIYREALLLNLGLNENDPHPHILMIAGGYDACTHVRIDRVAKYLQRDSNITVFPTIQINPSLIVWADIIVFQRQNRDDFWEFLELAKKLNKIIVFELDDNLHEVTSDNPAYSVYNPRTLGGAGIDLWQRNSNFVIASTPELLEFYRKRNNIVGCTLLNCYDFELNPEYLKKNNSNKVRIGWAGSISHYKDLKMVIPALQLIQQKHPNVEFVFMGWDGRVKQAKFNPKTKDVFFADLAESQGGHSLFDPNFLNFEYELWSEPNLYPIKLNNLRLDIAIAPIKNDLFNRCKSEIKVLEYGALEIPVVASKVAPYERPIKHGESGFLVREDKPEDWFKYLDILITDKNKRIKMGKKLYQKIRSDYDMARNYKKWYNLFVGIYTKLQEHATNSNVRTVMGNSGSI